MTAVAFPTHGCFHLECMKELHEVIGTVLASLVRMMDKARIRLLCCQSHTKRCDDQIFGDSLSRGIAYNLAIEEIFMGSAVEPPFIRSTIGNIADPNHLR